jgi:ribose/xylose/arabinose/galactoside ABC-type transport system permease subunit
MIDATTSAAGPNWKERLGRIHFLVYVILALYIVIPLLSSRFLLSSNQLNITRQVSVYLILGVGMTFVIISKGIDLSVGATFGFTAAVTADLIKNFGVNAYLGMGFALGFGAILGTIIGLMVTKLKVNAFIASLGMLTAYRGLTHLYLGSDVIVRLPKEIVFLGQGFIGFVPVPALLSILIALFGAWLLRYTRFGRYTVAIGSNEAACHVVAGINVDRYKIAIFAFAGAMAGFGSLLMIGRLNGTSAVLGQMYELHVIASVVMGGTTLYGGKGTILGTFLGVYTIGIIENGMVLIGADFHTQRVLIGFLLVFAVAFQGYRERKKGVMESR